MVTMGVREQMVKPTTVTREFCLPASSVILFGYSVSSPKAALDVSNIPWKGTQLRVDYPSFPKGMQT